MREIRALMAASEAKHNEIAARQNAQIAEIRGEIKEIRRQTEGFADAFGIAINNINHRLDGREKWQMLIFSVMGLAITLAAVVVAGVQVYLALKG